MTLGRGVQPRPIRLLIVKLPMKNKQPSEVEINQIVGLFNRGDNDNVKKQAQKLIKFYPKHPFGWKVLGAVLANLNQLEAALEAQLTSIKLSPQDVDALYNLGNTYRRLYRYEEAVKHYLTALKYNPKFALAYNNLALTLHDLGHFTQAVEHFRIALQMVQTNPEIYYNLGVSLQELGQLEEAIKHYKQAIQLDQRHDQAYNNLGNILKELGQLKNAETCLRNAIALNQNRIDAQSNLLFIYDHTLNACLNTRLSEAKRYGERVSEKAWLPYQEWSVDATPSRLKIGFVSGDFKDHQVGFFLENTLAQLDTQQFELFAYTNVTQSDAVTERLKGFFSHWHSIFGLSDEVAANLIHQHSLHILIDLSGHTGHNRLPLFAWNPAPIQATWLGYWATTGVQQIDYIFADKVGVPESHQGQFTETVKYLPNTRFCFSAPLFTIPVEPLPALSKGYLTFGCFQNLSKISDEALTVWKAILTQLPDAKIRFQCKQLRDKTMTSYFYQRLLTFGFKTEQISLHSATNRDAYLIAHHSIDFILDTFPYTGGTTTCEALWMGVPTLTLAGDTLLARQGASLLASAGLNEWIANDITVYQQKALSFASDLHYLSALRSQLREQVLRSPLFDAKTFAHHFGRALWEMWEEKKTVIY